MKLLTTLAAIYFASVSPAGSETPQLSPDNPDKQPAITNNISGLEIELNRALSCCEPYFDFSDYSMNTNANKSVLLGLGYDLRKVSEKHPLDPLKDLEKHAQSFFRLYCCQAVVGIENVMMGIKKTPGLISDFSISDIKSNFENAVVYYNLIKGNKKEKIILQNMGRRIERLPYEDALGSAEHYVSIKKHPIGVLRAMNSAARMLLDSEYSVSLEECNEFIRRTNKSFSFIRDSYSRVNEGVKKIFREEGVRFKELRTQVKEKYFASRAHNKAFTNP